MTNRFLLEPGLARGRTMHSRWSFYAWIDDFFAGQLGTVLILGAMLAASLDWVSGAASELSPS